MAPSRLPQSAHLSISTRAWLFAALFGLLLLGSQLVHVAQAEEPSANQTLPLKPLYLPALSTSGDPAPPDCPLTSVNSYSPILIAGTARTSLVTPDADPDLNLAVRGHVPVTGTLVLVDLGGDTDGDPPQLDWLFRPQRVPVFSGISQVSDWDWTCPTAPPGLGCLGKPLAEPEVTLLEMAITAGEPVYPPGRRTDILNGIYIALVLYAEETRLTVTYTREDTPAKGYVIHFEDLCVDPNLVSLYQALDQAGRRTLPGLRLEDPVGTAGLRPLQIAVRDTGSFMDPRSRKDWWCHASDPCP